MEAQIPSRDIPYSSVVVQEPHIGSMKKLLELIETSLLKERQKRSAPIVLIRPQPLFGFMNVRYA